MKSWRARVSSKKKLAVLKSGEALIAALQSAPITVEQIRYQSRLEKLLSAFTLGSIYREYVVTETAVAYHENEAEEVVHYLNREFTALKDYPTLQLNPLDPPIFGFHYNRKANEIRFTMPDSGSIPGFLNQLAETIAVKYRILTNPYSNHGYRTK